MCNNFAEEIVAKAWRYCRPKGVSRSTTPPASHIFMRSCGHGSGGVIVDSADQHVVRDLYAAAIAKNETLDLMEVRSTPTFRMYVDVDGGGPDILQTIHELVAPESSMAVCESLRRHRFHLYFPETVVDGDEARAIRARLIEKMTHVFPHHDWPKVFDASVYRPKCGLRMPWSVKIAGGPTYVPTHVYEKPGVLAPTQPQTPREWLDITTIRL